MKSDRKWDESERGAGRGHRSDLTVAGMRTQPLHTGHTLHQLSYWGATNTVTISLFPAPVEENQYVTCNCNADKLCIHGAHTQRPKDLMEDVQCGQLLFVQKERMWPIGDITTMMMMMMMMTVMMMIMKTLRPRHAEIDVVILADHWMAALAWCPISRGSRPRLCVSAKKDPVLQHSWEMTAM